MLGLLVVLVQIPNGIGAWRWHDHLRNSSESVKVRHDGLTVPDMKDCTHMGHWELVNSGDLRWEMMIHELLSHCFIIAIRSHELWLHTVIELNTLGVENE